MIRFLLAAIGLVASAILTVGFMPIALLVISVITLIKGEQG